MCIFFIGKASVIKRLKQNKHVNCILNMFFFIKEKAFSNFFAFVLKLMAFVDISSS